jgi:flagellar biosynthetic protein FliQ
MTTLDVVNIGREMLILTLLLSAPMLLVGLVIGLLISIFQAVTQINEMTLTFVPKIIAVALSIIIFLPWMLRLIVEYTTRLFESMNSFM